MYNEYFGLVESPFSITPDPRFFYINPLYQEAGAILHYGINAKKGFIVITGEVGTGKTTLLRKLMRDLGDTIHSVFIFNTHVDFIGLLRFIVRDLGLPIQANDKLMMIEELNRYLIEQLKKGDIVAVLIDEAQNLSIEALEGLRLLSNLETDKEKLLQIVLTGQPELERKLEQPELRQFKQRVALHCQLAPLKEKEVGAYIDFRLRAVGYKGEALFDPDAVDQIALYSRGIPRLINIICDNALLNAYGTSKKRVARDMIHEVARDLRLKAPLKLASINAPAVPMPAVDARPGGRQTARADRPQHRSSGAPRTRLPTLLILLLIVLAAAFGQNVIPDLKIFIASLREHPKARVDMEATSPGSAGTIEPIATKDVPPKSEPPGVLVGPERNPSLILRSESGREYMIQANDTLSGLAERHYGSQWRWGEIYAANKESITDPDYLYIGQKIIIPIYDY